MPQHLVAVDLGQHQIQHHQIGLVLRDLLQRRTTVRRLGDLESLDRQVADQHVADHRFVVDHEHALRRHRVDGRRTMFRKSYGRGTAARRTAVPRTDMELGSAVVRDHRALERLDDPEVLRPARATVGECPPHLGVGVQDTVAVQVVGSDRGGVGGVPAEQMHAPAAAVEARIAGAGGRDVQLCSAELIDRVERASGAFVPEKSVGVPTVRKTAPLT